MPGAAGRGRSPRITSAGLPGRQGDGRRGRGPTVLPVLGADTIVVLGQGAGETLRPARCTKDMLELLSGKVHQVMTAVAWLPRIALRRAVGDHQCGVFRKLDEAEIEAYWRTGEPGDKAGRHAIQGISRQSSSAASRGAQRRGRSVPAGARIC